MTLQEFANSLLSNQLLTGLSATALLGALFFQLRALPGKVFFLIQRAWTLRMEVNSGDPAYQWLDAWLAKQSYAQSMRHTILRAQDSDEYSNRDWLLVPGAGLHWFFWKRRLVFLRREITGPSVESPRKTESIGLCLVGRDPEVLRELIREAHAVANGGHLVAIYNWRGWWTRVRGKEARTLASIILRAGQMERLANDLAWFAGAKPWYTERGIPYRRGYLFSGPPGTGKTSVVFALAGHLKRPLCLINIGSVDNDNALFAAINDAPTNAILLLEDIDCAGVTRPRVEAQGESAVSDAPAAPDDRKGVSKAGLLNALDGVLTPEGRIFVLTTNYPEHLDAALIRPGRADVHEHFGFLDGEAQQRMAAKFYGEHQSFEPLPAVAPVSMQAAFMRHPDDLPAARQLLQAAA